MVVLGIKAVLGHSLALYGHRVTIALSAREVLQAGDRPPPDVALQDIRLPGLDGGRWPAGCESGQVRGAATRCCW